jgi:D-3-phosphoglycerate dehydrogenase
MQKGFHVQYDTSMDNDKLYQVIDHYTGIVINSKILMDQKMLDKAVNLKWIARLGSGMEIIDLNICQERGIFVCNAPEGNSHAVAEHELGMLLALSNHLIRADRQVREFNWQREQNRGSELRGKTLGIIGLGHTGCAFAEKCIGLGMNIIGYDKYRVDYPDSMNHIEKVSLKELKDRSDIISFHIPLTTETCYLVDNLFIAACRDNVIISNTSRGKIVKTTDLLEALYSGKVRGACLDVFENEKPETYSAEEREMYQKLYQLEQVVLSPHVAGWTHESLELIALTILKKIEKNMN